MKSRATESVGATSIVTFVGEAGRADRRQNGRGVLRCVVRCVALRWPIGGTPSYFFLK